MLAKFRNLLSRKFLIAVSGVAAGIIAIVGGETTEGVILITSSVLGYLAAEGYIDAKALVATLSSISDVADVVEKSTDNDSVADVAEIVGTVSGAVAQDMSDAVQAGSPAGTMAAV